MEWAWTHVEALSAAAGVFSALWALFAKIDRSFRKHLEADFATKKDLADGLKGLEGKLDILLIAFSVRDTKEKLKVL